MSRRFFSFSNSLFWVLMFLGGVFVFWRNKPTPTLTLRTSSTRKYEIAVFTSPGRGGGTRWSVYRRAQATDDWKYVMAMTSGETIKAVKAWQSADGSRILVMFPDSYFVANLETGVLERTALIIGNADLENLKSTFGIYNELAFAKPHKIGPWLWQDRQWKAMLHNDPQIPF